MALFHLYVHSRAIAMLTFKSFFVIVKRSKAFVSMRFSVAMFSMAECTIQCIYQWLLAERLRGPAVKSRKAQLAPNDEMKHQIL